MRAIAPLFPSSRCLFDVYSAPFATRKVSDETTSEFPLLKPPTGTPGAERQEFKLAGFPPKVEKDAEGNELPPDPEAPPPELVRPARPRLNRLARVIFLNKAAVPACSRTCCCASSPREVMHRT